MSYIPKVGEDCIYQERGGCRWNIKIDYIGKDVFVGTSDDGFELTDKLEQIKPSKTPAEIEREKGITQMFEDAEVQGSSGAFVRLYDKGYRKQQVKPLSRSYALQEIGLNDYGYKFMVDRASLCKVVSDERIQNYVQVTRVPKGFYG